MQKLIALSIMVLSIITPCAGQKSGVLIDDTNRDIYLEYKVYNKYVQIILISKTLLYPSIVVDVNKNGIIDNRFDRMYSIGNDDTVCSQYLLTDSTFTECGKAPSKATVIVGVRVKIFEIPTNELTTSVSSGIIHVGLLFYPRSPYFPRFPDIFETVYKIKIK